jgi:F-type H+-transporting ATPase subunit delta
MSLIEKRYAEAFLSLTVQNSSIDSSEEELRVISGIFESENELRHFLLSPKYDDTAKKKMLSDVFGGKTEKDTLNFLLLLVDKGRIKYLPGITREYTAMADKKRNILNITIRTAVPLGQQNIDGISERFKSLFRASSVKAAVEIDPSLVGGINVAVDGKLYDGTVKGKLSRLLSALDT